MMQKQNKQKQNPESLASFLFFTRPLDVGTLLGSYCPLEVNTIFHLLRPEISPQPSMLYFPTTVYNYCQREAQ